MAKAYTENTERENEFQAKLLTLLLANGYDYKVRGNEFCEIAGAPVKLVAKEMYDGKLQVSMRTFRDTSNPDALRVWVENESGFDMKGVVHVALASVGRWNNWMSEGEKNND